MYVNSPQLVELNLDAAASADRNILPADGGKQPVRPGEGFRPHHGVGDDLPGDGFRRNKVEHSVSALLTNKSFCSQCLCSARTDFLPLCTQGTKAEAEAAAI